MKAIEILAEEHRLLNRVLDCLERLLEETAEQDSLDGTAAARILEFLERYADGCHQEKEEEHLFPRLLARAPEAVRERVRELFVTHEDERRLLEGLRCRLEAAAYGDPLSTDFFAKDAGDYLAFQRDHASSEDVVLFPLAERYLGGDDDAVMLEGFVRTDAEYAEPGRADATQLAEELCERFGVDERRELGRRALVTQ